MTNMGNLVVWPCAKIICVLYLIVPSLTLGDHDGLLYQTEIDRLLNTCIDDNSHKSKPGPEDSLHAQCSPWTNRSCCTVGTSVTAHHSKMYNFDWSHCSHVVPLSSACRKHFQQDLCFYECSPNVGPWLVSVKQKIRNQRFINVPLCRSDCDVWFNDCKDDYTCTDNWGQNFKWTKSGNQCPEGASCKSFREVYNNNSTYFCETVWDHSWKVVNDNEHCMRLWFDPEHGNPNDAVAKWKAEEQIRLEMEQASGGGGLVHPGRLTVGLIGTLVLIMQCHWLELIMLKR